MDISEDTLTLGVDESYALSITSDGSCNINANTIWGALRGLETFTQLLERSETSTVNDTNNMKYKINISPIPSGDSTKVQSTVSCRYTPVLINDSARFTHRGVMIDTSRHYLPISSILRIIDSLPISKFNVLHWHTVDAQSFPLSLPSAPELVKGAYTPGMIYTTTDLSTINSYALDRGVRIVYEVDVPGHAASWTAGYPQIMADCFVKYSYNINDFALNPTMNETYDTVNKVLTDIVSATGAQYMHIGK